MRFTPSQHATWRMHYRNVEQIAEHDGRWEVCCLLVFLVEVYLLDSWAPSFPNKLCDDDDKILYTASDQEEKLVQVSNRKDGWSRLG
jgi:hypothetical protein